MVADTVGMHSADRVALFLLTSPLKLDCRHRSGKGTGGLSARETQIWLCAVSKSFNIDYFTMSKTTTSSDSAAASIKVVS